jgi:hypothetical protein
MKTKKLLFILFFGIALVAHSQQSAVVSGGNASGVGGTMSYSVGQVEFTTNTSTTGSLSQGVQQPFEIQTILGNEIPQINLIFLVYPNPTEELLTLDIGNFDFRKTTFQLFDLNGRLLIDKKIIEGKTKIAIDRYPSATYLLNVLDNNKILKTFKILKNE